MLTAQPLSAVSETASLPGAAVITRIRRLLISAVLAGLAYFFLMAATISTCAGGINAAGGFTDSSGQPTAEIPQCVTLTLKPSPFIYFGLALIVLLAINRVLKMSQEAAAVRVLDRSVTVIILLVIVAIVISQLWMGLTPTPDVNSESFAVFSPFPFGVIDVTFAPMPN